MFDFNDLFEYKSQFNDRECYIAFTSRCQWKCFYCDFPKKQIFRTTDKEYQERLELIKKAYIDSKQFWEFQIEGGELGLVSKDRLDFFFKHINLGKYHLATNGLFLEKYWDYYSEHIKTVLYHVFEDKTDDDIGKFEIKLYDGIVPKEFLFYTFVIHQNNIQLLEYLLDKYKDQVWLPHVMQPRTKSNKIMDMSYYNKIYNIIKDRDNVYPYFVKRYKEITSGIPEKTMNYKRFMCANNMTKWLILIEENRIVRCCISTETDSVPLTYDNLISLFNEISVFPINEKQCEGCIANFAFREYLTDMRNPRVKNIINLIKNEVNKNGN